MNYFIKVFHVKDDDKKTIYKTEKPCPDMTMKLKEKEVQKMLKIGWKIQDLL